MICGQKCAALAVQSRASSLVVKRQAVGNYDEHGRWTEGKITQIEVQATVQPARGIDLMRLDEGYRNRETILIFSLDELKTANVDKTIQADTVIWKGREFEVDHVEDWTDQGGFWKVLATRKGP